MAVKLLTVNVQIAFLLVFSRDGGLNLATVELGSKSKEQLPSIFEQIVAISRRLA